MNWSDLLAACSLYLVLEGILPFLSPATTKRFMASIADLGERQLRVWGLLSMVVGLILLYIVRS